MGGNPSILRQPKCPNDLNERCETILYRPSEGVADQILERPILIPRQKEWPSVDDLHIKVTVDPGHHKLLCPSSQDFMNAHKRSSY
jgi:hypothetical protein